MKQVLQDLSLPQLAALMEELGEPKYRAEQIYRGTMRAKRIGALNVPAALREKLLARFEDEPVKVREVFTSADGTEKYLFELADGNLIEGVLMTYKYGRTQCVSTQVGCRMNCAFCASGLNGLVRSLTAGEILAQVLCVNARAGGTPEKRAVTNVVLMGSGEPFDNYENVVRFLRNVSAAGGIGISPRNISLSTCGLVPQMYAFAEEGLPVNLTVSLHASSDEERARIMPVARAYKIADILAACDHYFRKTGRRYIFEYSLIAGVNDGRAHAERLAALLRGRPCHVNLIRLNEVKEKGLQGVSEKDAYRFLGVLERAGLSATLRRQIGADIGGACGQLRASRLAEGVPAENAGAPAQDRAEP